MIHAIVTVALLGGVAYFLCYHHADGGKFTFIGGIVLVAIVIAIIDMGSDARACLDGNDAACATDIDSWND